VVKALLGRKDVNPNQADHFFGHRPLTWVAKHGYEEVAEVLLEREDINQDGVDSYYNRTPLGWAVEGGHVGLVKMLLKREDVDPNQTVTEDGQTPLAWAAKNGHEGVAKVLLERENVNPDLAVTIGGRTPLSWAAENGHVAIVKRLLERKDVNPNQVDTKHDLTPLLWAAWKGRVEVVNIFVELGIGTGDCGDTGDEKVVFSESFRRIAHDRLLATGTNEFDTAARAQSWPDVSDEVQRIVDELQRMAGVPVFVLEALNMGITKPELIIQKLEIWEEMYAAAKSGDAVRVSIPYSTLLGNLLWDCCRLNGKLTKVQVRCLGSLGVRNPPPVIPSPKRPKYLPVQRHVPWLIRAGISPPIRDQKIHSSEWNYGFSRLKHSFLSSCG